MFDQLSNAYAQMQPGDKMVMHLHKAPRTAPQYQMPTATPDVGMGGGTPPVPPSPAMSMMPSVAPPTTLAGLSGGVAGGSMPGIDPDQQRQALIAALAARVGAPGV